LANGFRFVYQSLFPPFAFTRAGKAEGIIIDILSKALSWAGLEAAFIPSPMSQVETLLHSREVDAIACHGINPDRQRIFDFSDPLVVTGAGFFVDSSKPAIMELEEWEGKTIVTPRTGPLTKYLQKSFPEAKLLWVQDYPESLRTVLNGEGDAAALNIHVGSHLARQLFPGRFTVPDKIFLEVPVGVAVLKGDQSFLLNQINEGLRHIMKDGTYHQILNKWGGPS
jgi:polar amino acid transport system substrate-binding protein